MQQRGQQQHWLQQQQQQQVKAAAQTHHLWWEQGTRLSLMRPRLRLSPRLSLMMKEQQELWLGSLQKQQHHSRSAFGGSSS